jgi:hypothetical protein
MSRIRRRAVRIEVAHRFDVSLGEGFNYITDPVNWPAFWPRFVCVDPASRWREPGDRARLTLRLLAREVELEMTLDRLDPAASSSTQASGADFHRLGTGVTSMRSTAASPTGSRSSTPPDGDGEPGSTNPRPASDHANSAREDDKPRPQLPPAAEPNRWRGRRSAPEPTSITRGGRGNIGSSRPTLMRFGDMQ